MLGEVHELLQRPVSPEYISPKEDGLRALKGFLALLKARHPGRDVGQIGFEARERTGMFCAYLDKHFK